VLLQEYENFTRYVCEAYRGTPVPAACNVTFVRNGWSTNKLWSGVCIRYAWFYEHEKKNILVKALQKKHRTLWNNLHL